MEAYKGYENPQLVISAEELKGRLDDNTLCIVDTRPTYEYIRGHIPGALHLDLFGLSLIDTRKETFDAFMWMMAYLFQQRGLDPAKPIVWYERHLWNPGIAWTLVLRVLGTFRYAFIGWRF